MPLTPEDVSNKRFTTVRLREGYDMTEVDQFLDEVESELTRILQENTELRAKLEAAGGEGAGGDGAGVASGAERAQEAPPEQRVVVEGETVEPAGGEPVEEPAAVEPLPPTESATVVPAPAMETLRVTTTAEASIAATRLLELAGRNADQLLGEAREEAEQLLGGARATAEQLEAEARQRAEALEVETAERRQSVFGQIEEERTRLDSEIENLRAFEREYRAELRTYFEEQLAALEGQGAGGVLGRSERDDEVASPGQGHAPDDPSA